MDGQLRGKNVRLQGVKEGAENNSAFMTYFVVEILTTGLEQPPSTTLNIVRAHCALSAKPMNETRP